MTASRTVTVRTLDHGATATACPTWCNGAMHQPGEYRVDLAHSSDDTEYRVDTSRGPVPVLSMGLMQYPFTDRGDTTDVTVAVCLADGDHYRYDPAGLEQLADQLDRIAAGVRVKARELAALLEQDDQQ